MAPKMTGAAKAGRVVRYPDEWLGASVATAISPDGAAVAIKLFHAATVAVGAI